MVHHHRYHPSLKKGFQDEEASLQDFNKKSFPTKPKLLPSLALLFFIFVSCTFFFIPRFFSFYSFQLLNQGLPIHRPASRPICSSTSLAHGSICCERNSIRSDICYMKGDVRTHSASSSLLVYTSNTTTPTSHQTIKPYTRKWETGVMDTIDELHLLVVDNNNKNQHANSCQINHSVPAVFFSTGGYTGNVYHEFNDGILPLYITSQHFNKKVVFVLLEYHQWWITKYADILSQLSNYPPIDFTNDNTTHCFPEAIVGLKIHDELTIDSSLMALAGSNKTIADFRMLLNQAYRPRVKGFVLNEQVQAKLSSPPAPSSLDVEQLQQHHHDFNFNSNNKKPKLVILSRNGSRGIINENSLVELAEEIGFQVEILRPDRTTELAKIYMALNSSDTMLGVHGAAMTHFLFMRPGTVFIQVIPLGTNWAAQTYYGDPSIKLGLNYIGYKILPRESSLYTRYHKDDPVLTDPDSVNAKGWEFTKKVYLDGQNIKLNLSRFRKRLVRAYRHSISKMIQPHSI